MKRLNGEGTWGTQTTKGKKYVVFRVTINGKRKSFSGKTKKEVLEKYNNYVSNNQPVVATEDITFYEYAHNWLFDYKKNKVRIRTFDYYDFVIESFIKDTTLGKTTVKRLNGLSQKETIDLFANHLKQFSDKSKSTADGIYTVLNQTCKYGFTYQDFVRNFMNGVEKLSEKDVKVKHKVIQALDYSEVMKLWNEMQRMNEAGNIINNKAGTYVYGIGAYALLFCCFTGLRWGEVSVLKWEDIKNEDGRSYFKVDKQYITVKERDPDSDQSYKTIISEPKSEKSNRYIPLSMKACEILELVKTRFTKTYSSKHLIFSTTDNPYSASTANRLLKVMCIRAGVPVVSPHALRHSFASILLNEDERNLYAVSDLLGHSSSDVTYKKYIDIFEKNKINAIDLFDNIKGED